ncbi:hypothetical protein [Marinobacter sp. X15-166B]|uniref:hypothetical protein n=1 Tax=Marinobacter sp. X15-166B TaxID=1897620 RepID=UPI0013012D94|nr:hypothetical protein [Marinobacter sp. X15-166B]
MRRLAEVASFRAVWNRAWNGDGWPGLKRTLVAGGVRLPAIERLQKGCNALA